MAIEFDIQESSKLKGVFIITPNKFQDLRGEIWSLFTEEQIGILLPNTIRFKHDKIITSRQRVLRGIHGDRKTYKLVTCVYGEIQQVVVDCRKDSPTYLQWESFTINAKNQKLILIPPNMGNSYCVVSQTAVYYYKLAYDGEYLDAKDQFTYAWNDEKIGIDWVIQEPILSERDINPSDKNRDS